MKSNLIKIDQDYLDWISELSQRYRQSQIKAAVSVNSAMLRFYWSVGQDISRRQMENRYGSRFYERVGADLRDALNLKKGFSATTLKYTKYFYELYSPLFEICEQDIHKSDNANRLQDADDSMAESIRQQLADDSFPSSNRQQLAAYLQSKEQRACQICIVTNQFTDRYFRIRRIKTSLTQSTARYFAFTRRN